jgi:hypothetical protein
LARLILAHLIPLIFSFFNKVIAQPLSMDDSPAVLLCSI